MQKMKISKITLHDAASRKPYRTDGSLLKMLYPAMMDITKNGADTGRTGVRSTLSRGFILRIAWQAGIHGTPRLTRGFLITGKRCSPHRLHRILHSVCPLEYDSKPVPFSRALYTQIFFYSADNVVICVGCDSIYHRIAQRKHEKADQRYKNKEF